MDRRHFSQGIPAWVLLALASKLQAAPAVTTPKRILIIGAGLAGLACARELSRQGHTPTVIEGRDRIGGRIWTSHRWPDMPMDLGASWIHGVKNNPISLLADAIQAPRISTHYTNSRTYTAQGDELSEADERQLQTLRERVEQIIERAQDRDHDASVWQTVERFFNQLSPAQQTLLAFSLNSEFEQEYGGSLTELSTHWFDASQEFDGDDVLFEQGFGVVTQWLSKGLDIRTQQTVQEIRWDTPNVQVVTATDTFLADRVVVTVPLGVLKAQHIRFTPTLPAEKQKAIDRLGMGVLNKCYLRFEQAFWPKDVDWIEHVSTQPGVWTQWVSFMRAAQQPVLLGFNAATRGRAIEALSDEDIVKDAMSTLRKLFGAGIPQPIDAQITRWSSDPFALGSYSFNARGSTPSMRKDLGQSLKKRVYFAGEATHADYFGTAHGAYLSGWRAAQEVAQS